MKNRVCGKEPVAQSAGAMRPNRPLPMTVCAFLSNACGHAQLKLDADWVILSACNTAATDGTPGAEGLSGLAKAFFYAGSRALLVSHWPVSSHAAVAITTRMLAEAAKSGVGRAEAHRRAMLALIDDEDKPHYAHPLFWGRMLRQQRRSWPITS